METLHILIRVSTSVQEEEGTSLTTQKQLGIELSKQLGMNYQVHNEGGTSSSKDTLENRPLMINLLRLMDEGIVKHLYVYNTDRISRGNTWFLIRKKMVDNGVILYTSNGKYDTSGTMENLILGILSEVSQYDNKVRTERSRLGKIEKVKQNYYRGGDPPFGYRIFKESKGSKLVVDDYESKYVQMMFTMYSSGYSIKEIKKTLEDELVTTRRGNKYWSLGSIQLILRNNTYIGIDEFHDKKSGVTIRNEIPPIVSTKLFEIVQERRIKILSRKGQLNRTKYSYLFRNYMYCSCGSPIGGRVKTEKSVYQYYCPTSERKFNKSDYKLVECEMKRCIHIQKTEKLLWDTISKILKDNSLLNEKLKLSIDGKSSLKSLISKQKTKIEKEILEKQNELKVISGGIVEIERGRLLNLFPSEEVYSQLKRKLDSDFRKCHIEIENLKNSIKFFQQKDSWNESIKFISTLFNTTTKWTKTKKDSVLKSILDKIILNHDSKTKLHHLDIHLRIPLVLHQNKKGASSDTPLKMTYNPLISSGDYIQSRPFYSTVTDFAKFLGWSTLHPLMTAIW